MKRNKKLDIIIAVVIAIVLWAYIIVIVNPPMSSTIRQVPVSITGEDVLRGRGLAIAFKQNYAVDVKISGSRNEISGLSIADFAASVDVSGLGEGETNMTVAVTGPYSITIDEVNFQKIPVRIDPLVSIDKPVKINLAKSEEGEITVLKAMETVAVRGAESDVAMAARVEYEIGADKLKKDEAKVLSLMGTPVDADGKVLKNVATAAETIDFTVVFYETKSIAINIVLEGSALYGENSIEKIEHTPAIKIKGPSAVVGEISGITEVIDITGLDKNTEIEPEIHLPKDVFLSDDSESVIVKIYISESAKLEYEAAQPGDVESGKNKGE